MLTRQSNAANQEHNKNPLAALKARTGLSYSELGKRLGVSRSRACQIAHRETLTSAQTSRVQAIRATLIAEAAQFLAQEAAE